MRPLAHGPSLAALTLVLGVVLPPRAALGAWPNDPSVNVQIASAAGNQYVNAVVSDGAGGVIVAWSDHRGSSWDIYAQRITATGVVAPGWPAGGVLVCGATGDQYAPVLASDGGNGAVVAWEDARLGAANRDIFAIRINANGTLGGGWPADGRLLSVISEPKDEQIPVIASDGAGGAFVAWELVFTSPTDLDVYAAHVTGGSTVAWSFGAVTPGGVQDHIGIVPDAAGGVILSYEDNSAGNYDIRAIRLNAAGGTVWGPINVCSDAAVQLNPRETSDGAGGALVTWSDFRNGSTDVFAVRITAAGNPAVGWTANGNEVCIDPNTQQNPAIVSDGNHGAIIAWLDGRFFTANEVFAQHVLGSGAVAPGWPVDGAGIASGSKASGQFLTPDGAGGAIVSWSDGRNGLLFGADIYATRVTSAGVLAPGWTYGGTPVSLAAALQTGPLIATDGAGGALMAWTDYRDPGSVAGAYAQRIDLFGQIGNAEPAITRVKDVAGDQGGKVRVDWSASYLDANPTYGVSSYWIWRQALTTTAMEAVRHGGAWMNARLEAALARGTPVDQAALARRGLYQMTSVDGVQYAWEFLSSQPASALVTYSYVASTTTDSIGGSNPYTPFMVQARGTASGTFWSSAPDSGYSVDNLPPAAPTPFYGEYAGGTSTLHWGHNTEPDFTFYRLYRGTTPGFVPDPSSLVIQKDDTGYVDAAGAPYYYKVCAFDVHGNESPCSVALPSGTVDVGGAPRQWTLWLGPAAPNPMRETAALRYTLPRQTRVSLAIYDAGGRRVREIEGRVLPAGEHTAVWDGRDASGNRVSSGLYFVRLEAEGRTLRGRILTMR